MKKIPRISKEEYFELIKARQEEPENQYEWPDSILDRCMNAIHIWNGHGLILFTFSPSSDIDNADAEPGNPLDYEWVKEELEYVKVELEKLGWSIKEAMWPGNDGPDSVTIIIE